MFKLNLGQDTAHSLTEENFRELGQRTEGYSGADVALVVRDALMQVRKQEDKRTHALITKLYYFSLLERFKRQHISRKCLDQVEKTQTKLSMTY